MRDSGSAGSSQIDVGVKHCTILLTVADSSLNSHPSNSRLHAFYPPVLSKFKLKLLDFLGDMASFVSAVLLLSSCSFCSDFL